MDDNAIVTLFYRRSEDAIAECQSRFGAYCRAVALNILHNINDAEECVSDTWLRAWNAIPPARPSLLKAFLGKITRNVALDRYESAHSKKRGGGSVELALDELADIPVPENANEGEITDVINEFLRLEPVESADIFVKRYWYLKNVGEVADEYGYSENKVTSLLFRMRKRLRAKLESEGLV